jgi:hypothetical protein
VIFFEAFAGELSAPLVPSGDVAFHARGPKVRDVEERAAARRLDDVVQRVRDAVTARQLKPTTRAGRKQASA